MALYKFGITGELRGSIGGITFSRNKFGAVIRSKTKNNFVKPLLKMEMISFFSYFSNYWKTQLAYIYKHNWDLYAADTPMLNSLKETYYMSGMNAFIRCNTIGFKIGRNTLTGAPLDGGFTPVGVFDSSEITIDKSANTISFNEAAFPSFDHAVDDDSLVLFQCPCCYYGTNFIFFKEKYLGHITGNSGTPPAFPQVFSPVYPIFTDGIVGLVARRLDPEGKYSGKTACGVIVVA